MEKVKIPCSKCGGKGVVEVLRRTPEEIIANCRLPGATNNELEAASLIERLLAMTTGTGEPGEE